MEYVVQHPAFNRSTLGRAFFERSIAHYSNSHHILLVGEGDFSFSLALAIAFGSAENMVSTSLDSREKVLQLYGYESTHKTLSNLDRLGATILHGVNATTMENHHLVGMMRFHRIVYNFPHAGFYGREENENVIEKHRHLLKLFFKNAKTMLSEDGEIHVTHKENGPYKKWELVKQAAECGLLLKESVHFTKENYPGYINRRGAPPRAGDTFFLGECRTYKFVMGPGLLYQRRLMGMPVALSNVSSGASVEGFNAVLREPEPGRKIRMGWETMRMDWETEFERQWRMDWEREQMRMGWEIEVERQRRMGWESEVERQMRMSVEPMKMGWIPEQMRMGWETEVERQRRIGG